MKKLLIGMLSAGIIFGCKNESYDLPQKNSIEKRLEESAYEIPGSNLKSSEDFNEEILGEPIQGFINFKEEFVKTKNYTPEQLKILQYHHKKVRRIRKRLENYAKEQGNSNNLEIPGKDWTDKQIFEYYESKNIN